MRVLQAMAGGEFGGAEAFFTRLVLAEPLMEHNPMNGRRP